MAVVNINKNPWKSLKNEEINCIINMVWVPWKIGPVSGIPVCVRGAGRTCRGRMEMRLYTEVGYVIEEKEKKEQQSI